MITKYLNEIEDLELRLSLATQVEVFDVGIEVRVFSSAFVVSFPD